MFPESPGPRQRVNRRQVLAGAFAAALPALALPVSAGAAKPLMVGGLPVTCNLTLPVACVARSAANGADKSAAPSGLQLSTELTLDFFGFEAVRQREELLPVARHSCALQSAPIRMLDAERMDGLDSSAQRQRAKVVGPDFG